MPTAFGRFLNGLGYPHHQLWEHVMQLTLTPLRKNDEIKGTWRTAEDVRTRASVVRRWFLQSIGGIPKCEEPIGVQSCGAIDRENYLIEKLILETAPNVYVSSCLYLPKRKTTTAPAVLFLCGHHLAAKAAPEYQRVCHDLATEGFLVLAIDPTGQGERVSFFDTEKEDTPSLWGVWEHAYQGLQCVLLGTSIARYFLFDALRGIDYLQSRPEVDPEKIGVTGNSGGGTQATLLCMSGDPRIKVAVPCTYVTSREHYVQTGQPQDAEQIQFGINQWAIDYDDMFLPFAPRPLLIGAVEDDFFNPEGTAHTYHRIKRHYKLLGATDNVACVFSPGNHRYSRELRTAAVNWFRLHLANKAADFVSQDDQDIECLPESDLWCTPEGHLRSHFPNLQTPYHRNASLLVKPTVLNDTSELINTVIETLGIDESLANPCDFFPRVTLTQDYNGARISSIVFISEPGIWLSGCLIEPKEASKQEVIIYLVDGGTKLLDDFLGAISRELVAGQTAFLLDVRGIGAVETVDMSCYGGPFPGSMLNTTSWIAWLAYCAGKSLVGMRVFDVIRATQMLREKYGFSSIGLHAAGVEPALWGYLAAAIDNKLEPIIISGLISSFADVVRTERYRTDILPSAMIHGILRKFDLPDLVPLFRGRTCQIETVGVNACE